jgi:hypothetical protein
MERRLLIKQIVFVTSGALLLPSCLRSVKDHMIKYKNFDLTEAQIKLMANLSEQIIPLKETPQANGEKLHLFIIKMVDECMIPKDQKYFVSGLKELQHYMDKKHLSYPLSNSNKHTELISKLERQELGGNIPKFYAIFKKQLINGYLNSAYFMKDVIEYKLIPGNYQAHISTLS